MSDIDLSDHEGGQQGQESETSEEDFVIVERSAEDLTHSVSDIPVSGEISRSVSSASASAVVSVVPQASNFERRDMDGQKDVREGDARGQESLGVGSGVTGGGVGHASSSSDSRVVGVRNVPKHGGTQGSTPCSLDVLYSLWRNPIHQVAPKGVFQWGECGAYVERAFRRLTYGPQYMADPLYVIGYTWTINGTDSTVCDRINVAGSIVEVSEQRKVGAAAPKLSARGSTLLSNALSTPMDASMQLKNLVPTGGSVNLQAMTILLSKYANSIDLMARDEGPLLRGFLLLLEYMPQNMYVYRSNSLLSLRLGGMPTTTKVVRHKADERGELDGTIQIPFNCKDCNIRVIPLVVYMYLVTGQRIEIAEYKDVKLEGANIVAVQSVDLLQDWFTPFLIAHTTTLWWNCSTTYEHTIAHAGRKTGTSLLTARCMRRSSCVYVPGNWQNTIVVVTDIGHTKEPFQTADFGEIKLGEAISEVTKKVFTYLGLTGGAAPNVLDILTCVNKMCRKTALEGDEDVVLSMVQELCFNLKLGGSVMQGVSYSTTGFGRMDVTSNDYKLEGSELFDLADTWDNVIGWLTAFGDWSVSPCGKMQTATFDVTNKKMKDGKEITSKFALYNIREGARGYKVSETSGPMRVMRECGLFHGRAECERDFGTYSDLFNTLQAGASLMAGVAGWVMCEVGFNVMDLNAIYMNSSRCGTINRAHDLVTAVTDGFILRSDHIGRRYTETTNFIKYVQNFLGVKKNKDGILNFDWRLWPSIHVPFWYIVAVTIKFGAWTKLPELTRHAAPLNDIITGTPSPDIDDAIWDRVYKVTAQVGDWRTLPALCAQMTLGGQVAGFERGRPRFYLPTRLNGRPALSMVGVMPFYGIDMSREMQGQVIWALFMIEPMAIPFVALRQEQNEWMALYAIIRDVPLCPFTPEHPITVVMEFPDPPPEWLQKVWSATKSSLVAAIPNLMKGDLIGALGSVGINLVVKGIQSLAERMGEERSFSGAVMDDKGFEHTYVNK
uniref:Putative capsid protein n=1 Tax=Embera virus TaxID=2689337 RepID=A0A6B9KGN1_9VIRU|nr:putative capsid protein [Embera virus]